MKRIDAFPTAKDFTIVTSSSGNKTWIQNLIKSALMKVSHERKIVWSVGRTCVSLNDEQEIPEFQCNQVKADTILITIYYQLRAMGENDAAVLDTQDTDVYI